MTDFEDGFPHIYKAASLYGKFWSLGFNKGPVHKSLWTHQFRERTIDAIYLLRGGNDKGEVIAKHGIVVYRTAIAYLHDKL